jgi:YbgC/YbaW family acyl-CoA thioester hydrolase
MAFFETTRTATFHDCDPAGIVFFGRFFFFAHDALEDYCRSKGIWDEWFNNPKIAVPIVSCNANYLQPLKLGQTYKVQIVIIDTGNTSITFNFTCEAMDGKTIAKVTSTHVFLAKPEGKPCAIPPFVASHFSK